MTCSCLITYDILLIHVEKELGRWKYMIFDFKKTDRVLYTAKEQPQIIDVPEMKYVAVRGKGDPNELNGTYSNAIHVLYAIAYTLKMSYKGSRKIKGFFEFVVPPLEGFWWQEDIKGVDYSNKNTFNWIAMIRTPDFVTQEDFKWAVEEATKKKKLDCALAEYLIIKEGLCVQMMHRGSFDDEPTTVAIMDEFLREKGYVNDFTDKRLHHEIYLSDARKVEVEKWKTIIRHPIKKKQSDLELHNEIGLVNNLHKLHTTPMGIARIKRNLSLGDEDVVQWCQQKIKSSQAIIEGKGKNWYVHIAGCCITINAHSYTIITAHKEGKSNE